MANIRSIYVCVRMYIALCDASKVINAVPRKIQKVF